jgi:hypothetical protein
MAEDDTFGVHTYAPLSSACPVTAQLIISLCSEYVVHLAAYRMIEQMKRADDSSYFGKRPRLKQISVRFCWLDPRFVSASSKHRAR